MAESTYQNRNKQQASARTAASHQGSGKGLQDNRPVSLAVKQLKQNNTGLPDNLKSGIENLSGMSMDDVKVHYNSSQPAQINALAYAQGADIHVAPGQEQHLPHEAWHVVQQAQGRVRPTMQMKDGGPVNNDQGLEREADVMGEKASAVTNVTQCVNEGPLQGGKVLLNFRASQNIVQCLKKFKDENEAISYFEDALLDDLDGNFGEVTQLIALAAKHNWEDLSERINYYLGEHDLGNSKKKMIKAIGGMDLSDPLNLPAMVKMLQTAQTEGWDDVEEILIQPVRRLEDERDVGLVSVKHTAKKSPTIDLQNIKNMSELLGILKVDVSRYKVPLDVKVFHKMKRDVGKFNEMIDRISSLGLFTSSFDLSVNVGDLKGYGDVMAGAKLAKELDAFYHLFEQWKNVNIRLYLAKVKNLMDEKKSEKNTKEIEKIITMAKSVLSGSRVSIGDNVEDELSANQYSIDLTYPVVGISSDVSVSQYGHNQFSTEFSTYGSGPGYGALGILPVPNEKKLLAIDRAEKSTSKMVVAIKELEETYKITRFHFGYFSIYEKRPKEFAQFISEKSDGLVIGIAIAKSADKAESMADSLSAKGHNVQIVSIKKNGEYQAWPLIKARKKSSGKLIVLVDLPEGVDNEDMLSLYYKSDAPVGATGDQSFMEAYTMRNEKNKKQKSEKGMPDILYDVSDQQQGLFHQLGELHSSKIEPQKGNRGLKEVNLKEGVDAMILQKNLLFPIVMLINDALLKKVEQ